MHVLTVVAPLALLLLAFVAALDQGLKDFVKANCATLAQQFKGNEGLLKLRFPEQIQKLNAAFPGLELPTVFSDDAYNKLVNAVGEDNLKQLLKFTKPPYNG